MDTSNEQNAESEGPKGQRRLCQACFRIPAEHLCQVCRRFICDDCVTPPGQAALDEADSPDALEHFLQLALTRCRACRDADVDLPPDTVEVAS